MTRLSWWSVPDPVRERIGRRLGARVVEATTQPGGFSPGVAALCSLDDGRSVFVKACGTDINPMTVELHRQEAMMLDRLRDVPFVPQLLDVVEVIQDTVIQDTDIQDMEGIDGARWIALIVAGVHARMPTARDRSAVSRALALLPRVQSLAVDGFPERHEGPFAQLQVSPWADMRADETPLDPWSGRHLDSLVELERASVALGATVVCHGDFRLDNVLFAADGHTLLADWAQAAVGPPCADLVEVCIDIEVEGGQPAARTFAAHAPALLRNSPDDVTAYLAAVAGRWTRLSTFAEPPGITGLRAFQRRQGESARAWLADRMERRTADDLADRIGASMTDRRAE